MHHNLLETLHPCCTARPRYESSSECQVLKFHSSHSGFLHALAVEDAVFDGPPLFLTRCTFAGRGSTPFYPIAERIACLCLLPQSSGGGARGGSRRGGRTRRALSGLHIDAVTVCWLSSRALFVPQESIARRNVGDPRLRVWFHNTTSRSYYTPCTEMKHRKYFLRLFNLSCFSHP